MASFFNLLRILRIMEIMFSDSLTANKSPRETPCGFSSSSVIAAKVNFSDAAFAFFLASVALLASMACWTIALMTVPMCPLISGTTIDGFSSNIIGIF